MKVNKLLDNLKSAMLLKNCTYATLCIVTVFGSVQAIGIPINRPNESKGLTPAVDNNLSIPQDAPS
ncbi:hypothetical protein K7432_011857 [Basidiobolus ranarum]|uniref:Uncharacterized protein n=1 Tax=Basidiobolus ranarum TaxID=34480 RepID=A0ABR2VTB9_9FUNG